MCTADFEKLWVANLRVSLKKAAQTLFVLLSEKKTNLNLTMEFCRLAGYWLGRYSLRGVTIVLKLWLVGDCSGFNVHILCLIVDPRQPTDAFKRALGALPLSIAERCST